MNTPDEIIDGAWTLANKLTNVVGPALRARDELIRDLIRELQGQERIPLGADYYIGQANELGVDLGSLAKETTE